MGVPPMLVAPAVECNPVQLTPTFSGNTLTIGNRSWSMPYAIHDARRLGDRIVVIYDYRGGPKDGPFRNLEAFDDSGRKLWTAESPGSSAADAYVEFISDVPLVVWNFTCFRCEIDPNSGKLIQATFTK